MGLQEEITELEQRFAQAPDSRLFLPLADALRRAGELERAEKLCRDGLERFPDFTSARILLGECLAERGELEQAGRELEQAARADSGNRRLKAGLAEISGKLSASADGQRKVAADEKDMPVDETVARPETDERPGDKQREEPAVAGETGTATEAGGMGEAFVTHTLGDIYRMQGHDRKAFEVYKQLVEQGKNNPELREKIEELASRLGVEGAVDEAPVSAMAQEVGEESAGSAPRVRDGERFEERIDSIFHFLLGDSPEHGEPGQQGVAAPGSLTSGDSGSEGFVDLLEDWIDDLKQGA